jgi:hypothetical protein
MRVVPGWLRRGEGVGFGVGTIAIDGLGLGTGELVTGGGVVSVF